MNSIYLHPGELAPHPLNSNDHNEANIAELAASLELFQQYKNIVSWTPAEPVPVTDTTGKETTLKPGINYILAGHGLVLAAIKRGWDKIEVKDYSHLTHEQALLLIETDNAAPLGSQRNAAQMAANLDRARALYVDDERMRRMLDRARIIAKAYNGNDDFDPMAEWIGMPEFEQEDKTAHQSIHVHFENPEVVQDFAELIGQKITENTRSLWYPEIKIERYADKQYTNAA